MISQAVQDALNDQINREFEASYNYLAMSAYLRTVHFHGFAKWMQAQSSEEYGHAMKLYGVMTEHGCRVVLKEIATPQEKFESVRDAFEKALAQEIDVTRRINALYELAQAEKAFSAVIALQWFVTEQVEEERSFRGIIAAIKAIESEPAALLDMDRGMGHRE